MSFDNAHWHGRRKDGFQGPKKFFWGWGAQQWWNFISPTLETKRKAFASTKLIANYQISKSVGTRPPCLSYATPMPLVTFCCCSLFFGSEQRFPIVRHKLVIVSSTERQSASQRRGTGPTRDCDVTRKRTRRCNCRFAAKHVRRLWHDNDAQWRRKRRKSRFFCTERTSYFVEPFGINFLSDMWTFGLGLRHNSGSWAARHPPLGFWNLIFSHRIFSKSGCFPTVEWSKWNWHLRPHLEKYFWPRPENPLSATPREKILQTPMAQGQTTHGPGTNNSLLDNKKWLKNRRHFDAKRLLVVFFF